MARKHLPWWLLLVHLCLESKSVSGLSSSGQGVGGMELQTGWQQCPSSVSSLYLLRTPFKRPVHFSFSNYHLILILMLINNTSAGLLGPGFLIPKQGHWSLNPWSLPLRKSSRPQTSLLCLSWTLRSVSEV